MARKHGDTHTAAHSPTVDARHDRPLHLWDATHGSQTGQDDDLPVAITGNHGK